MKPTESYEQLLERFQKRIYQLQERKRELQDELIPQLMEEERKVERDLTRVEGSLQAVEYLAFGKLPHDGNHDGMKDHKPLKHGNLDALD